MKNPALRTICLGSRSLPTRPVVPLAGATKHVADAGGAVDSAGRSDERITAVGEKSAIPRANDTAGLGITEGISCGRNSETLAASCREMRLGDAPLLPASYPGIQADPTEMLLNGQPMKASFAAPDVRLANFDK